MKKIMFAESQDLAQVAILFNDYRVFYKQPSDLMAAEGFIKTRFIQQDSKIFVCKNKDQKIMGFVQLYPTFSSVSLKRAWILNDLYVSEFFREKGVATALLEAVQTFAKQTKAAYIMLETAKTNLKAQSLYQQFGFKQHMDTLYLVSDL